VLQVEHTGPGGPALVLLTGSGAAAALTAAPLVTHPGTVVTVSGQGFPPGHPVVLTLGTGPERTTAVAGPDGTLRAALLVFPEDAAGRRSLTATSDAGAPPVTASGRLLVEPGTVEPPDLVSRG
jgi:hypothetical protein